MTATVDQPATQHGTTTTTTTTTTTRHHHRHRSPRLAPGNPTRRDRAGGRQGVHRPGWLPVRAVARLGDRLGLFRAMAGAGPLTSAALAQRAGLVERYVREWVRAVAIGGYVDYRFDQDAAADTYTLSPEMAMVLAEDDSPVALIGVVPSMADIWDSPAGRRRLLPHRRRSGVGRSRAGDGRRAGPVHPAAVRARPGRRVDPGDRRDGQSAAERGEGGRPGHGLGRVDRPGRRRHGRRRGSSAPIRTASRWSTARRGAAAGGVADRAEFVVADAAQHPGFGYDLVIALDCLHDMGDPIAALRHVREILAPDGVLLVAEPLAADRFADDFANPYARIGYCDLHSGLPAVVAVAARQLGAGRYGRRGPVAGGHRRTPGSPGPPDPGGSRRRSTILLEIRP